MYRNGKIITNAKKVRRKYRKKLLIKRSRR
jgi:hypothetical protein